MFFDLNFFISSPIGRVRVAKFPLVSKDLIESCVNFVCDNLHSEFWTVEAVNNYELEIGGDVDVERLRLDL